jgi:3',5'-cyclic AMP phosphodiesterase CpdA
MNTSRRAFLKQSSLVVPALLLNTEEAPLPHYTYPRIRSLEDARMKDGWTRVRIELSSTSPERVGTYEGNIRIKGAGRHEIRSWFFEGGEDHFNPETQAWKSEAAQRSVDVLVIKLLEPNDQTHIRLTHAAGDFSFYLQELVASETLTHSWGNTLLQANLLLDHEIGHIDWKELGMTDPGEEFQFVIMADPQGGDPGEPSNRVPTRMKIHNAFIEESIRVINELDPQPAFTIVNGDIVDSEGQARNFAAMLRFFEVLKSPLLFEAGNHETRYNSVFTPGYNMTAFDNFFAAQKQVNGLEKLLYSFEIGRWHFVVFPDPLRRHFWETHPHYFEWLEADLEAYKDWPVIFLHHVPLHPIGIDPLTSYVESPYVKRTLLDILSKWGHVKYVFSGHVHIPLKASVKTAVSYRGMKLINLPAAGYRPRSFGEADFDGGPTQGVAIVAVKGTAASVSFRTVTNYQFHYPDTLPEFRPEDWPLWLNSKWELPATPQLVNGSFEQGLEGWHRRYVYQEDERVANLCEVRRLLEKDHFHALYLFTQSRDYPAPGQDRMPQTINHLCQAIEVPAGRQPVLHLSYRLDPAYFDPSGASAAFVWIEGYSKSHKYLNLVYAAGTMIADPGGVQSQAEQTGYRHLDLPGDRDGWNEGALNIWADGERTGEPDARLALLAIDRLVINLGVWTQNDEGKHAIAVFFDELRIEFADANTVLPPSHIGSFAVDTKAPAAIWNKQNHHIAGEHQYVQRKS